MYLRFLFIGCILCSLSSTCKSRPEKNDRPAATYCIQKDFKEKIKIEEVRSAPVAESIHLMGSVETNPDKVVEYVSLIKGVVAAVHFSLGDAVQKGQVLAELRSAELSALQAQAASLDAEIQSAQRTIEAVASMHEDRLASDRDLAEAQSRLQSLQSEKRRVTADLGLYSADMSKGVFQIKAPASGIITSKALTAGMQIAEGSGVLFTIASLNTVWVMANVYATNLQAIHPGMSVEISTLSYPDVVFKGKISVLSPVMDENEKVLKARIAISNDDYKLKPGMLVDVNALKESASQACAIPVNALVFYENENYVIVYKEDCSVLIRKVAIIAQNDRTYYIGEGLEPGEKILTQNQLLVFEQLRNFEH